MANIEEHDRILSDLVTDELVMKLIRSNSNSERKKILEKTGFSEVQRGKIMRVLNVFIEADKSAEATAEGFARIIARQQIRSGWLDACDREDDSVDCVTGRS